MVFLSFISCLLRPAVRPESFDRQRAQNDFSCDSGAELRVGLTRCTCPCETDVRAINPVISSPIMELRLIAGTDVILCTWITDDGEPMAIGETVFAEEEAHVVWSTHGLAVRPVGWPYLPQPVPTCRRP